MCGEMLLRGEIGTHQLKCPHQPIRCEQQCGLEVRRCDRQKHIARECSKTILECMWCSKQVERGSMQLHVQNCGRRKIQCPKNCGLKVRDSS